jgi:hypothetical protein
MMNREFDSTLMLLSIPTYDYYKLDNPLVSDYINYEGKLKYFFHFYSSRLKYKK